MGLSKVVERWPVFARQVRGALGRDGEAELASQVDELRVVELCECGDDFCQSFYVERPPDDVYPSDSHRSWYCDDEELGWDGHLILDVVDERIAFVEVLYRAPLD
ncbi:hypothetical protein [Kribbella deserti]|uniref:Uncharacterized protein n=1 Tax=Kribbella deserti TaxID=1926257 RepID=A0ABV6QXU0_9ACTN